MISDGQEPIEHPPKEGKKAQLGQQAVSGAARRLGWGRVLGIAIGAALIGVLTTVLVRRWRELPEGVLRPSWWLLAATVPLFVAATAVLALQWRAIVKALGEKMSPREAIGIHFLSQVGKYVPGKVALLVGKFYLCVRQGMSRRVAALSVAYEQAFTLVAGALVVFACALWTRVPVLQSYRIVLLPAVLLGVACLHPRVVRLVLRAIARMLPGQVNLRELGGRVSVWLVIRYALSWTFAGLAFYILACGLHEMPLSYLPDCIGILTLSTIAGFLAVITPAGLGVREATMSALLSAHMPVGAAIAISLALRVVVTLAEIVCLLSALLLGRGFRRAIAAAADPDRRPPLAGEGQAE